MKLIRFGQEGHEKPGIIINDIWYDVSGIVADYNEAFFASNQIEKIRTRFDIGTTEKFSKQLKLHSYLAYGFGDEKFKGKFDVNYRFKKETGIRIWASYTNDLDNGKAKQADEDATIDNMFSQIIRRPNIKQKFIGVNEIKFGVTKAGSFIEVLPPNPHPSNQLRRHQHTGQLCN